MITLITLDLKWVHKDKFLLEPSSDCFNYLDLFKLDLSDGNRCYFAQGPLREYLLKSVIKPNSPEKELYKLLMKDVLEFRFDGKRIIPYKFRSKSSLLNYILQNYRPILDNIKSGVAQVKQDYEYISDVDILKVSPVKEMIEHLRSLILLEDKDINLLIFSK